MLSDGDRREQILDAAANVFASSGIRASLQEIGDACGILPGSLYYHFESKNALIIELIQRYRDQLDDVASTARHSLDDVGLSTEQRVIELGERIAACAVRNRAALLLTIHEPPATSDGALISSATHAAASVTEVMIELLEAGRTSGEIRPEVDAALLGERITQSMLHVGIGVFHRSQAAKRLPTMKCEVYLHGVASSAPSDDALDRSAARKAADEVISTWSDLEAGEHDTRLRIKAAGRAEFGRRGYEATTMRHVAKHAGLSTGTVYRKYRSKDELLLSIMQSFSETFAEAWDAVLGSESSVVEKLDGLLWVNIKLLERFHEEFKIQLAWLRQSPPDSINLGLNFEVYLAQLQQLIVAGEKNGTLIPGGSSIVNRTRSLYEMILIPERIVLLATPKAALTMARESVLRGALTAR